MTKTKAVQIPCKIKKLSEVARSPVIGLAYLIQIFWRCLSDPFGLPRRLKRGSWREMVIFKYLCVHMYLRSEEVRSDHVTILLKIRWPLGSQENSAHFLACKSLEKFSHRAFLVSLLAAEEHLNYIWVLGTLMHSDATGLCLCCSSFGMPFHQVCAWSPPAPASCAAPQEERMRISACMSVLQKFLLIYYIIKRYYYCLLTHRCVCWTLRLSLNIFWKLAHSWSSVNIWKG